MLISSLSFLLDALLHLHPLVISFEILQSPQSKSSNTHYVTLLKQWVFFGMFFLCDHSLRLFPFPSVISNFLTPMEGGGIFGETLSALQTLSMSALRLGIFIYISKFPSSFPHFFSSPSLSPLRQLKFRIENSIFSVFQTAKNLSETEGKKMMKKIINLGKREILRALMEGKISLTSNGGKSAESPVEAPIGETEGIQRDFTLADSPPSKNLRKANSRKIKEKTEEIVENSSVLRDVSNNNTNLNEFSSESFVSDFSASLPRRSARKTERVAEREGVDAEKIQKIPTNIIAPSAVPIVSKVSSRNSGLTHHRTNSINGRIHNK